MLLDSNSHAPIALLEHIVTFKVQVRADCTFFPSNFYLFKKE